MMYDITSRMISIGPSSSAKFNDACLVVGLLWSVTSQIHIWHAQLWLAGWRSHGLDWEFWEAHATGGVVLIVYGLRSNKECVIYMYINIYKMKILVTIFEDSMQLAGS